MNFRLFLPQRGPVEPPTPAVRVAGRGKIYFNKAIMKKLAEKGVKNPVSLDFYWEPDEKAIGFKFFEAGSSSGNYPVTTSKAGRPSANMRALVAKIGLKLKPGTAVWLPIEVCSGDVHCYTKVGSHVGK